MKERILVITEEELHEKLLETVGLLIDRIAYYDTKCIKKYKEFGFPPEEDNNEVIDAYYDKSQVAGLSNKLENECLELIFSYLMEGAYSRQEE